MAFSLVTDSFLGLLVGVSYAFFSVTTLYRDGVRLRLMTPMVIVMVMIVGMISFMLYFQMVRLGHRALVLEPFTPMPTPRADQFVPSHFATLSAAVSVVPLLVTFVNDPPT